MPYIGNSPGTGTRNRYIYTATASQTTFSGADDNGKTLAYSDGDYVDVFLNGICLVPVDDYTATSKTSIVLTVGAAASDTLEVVAYDIATIADTVSKANGGQFDGDVAVNASFTVDNGSIKLDGNYPTGTGNVALGNTSLTAITTGGNYNTAVGANALKLNTSGNQNAAFGFEALRENTTGYNNTAVGLYAGLSNTTGLNNVAVGTSALNSNTTASNNTAVGYQAGYSNTTGTQHVAMGRQALYSNTTGTQNTAIGQRALYDNSTGSFNTAVGYSSLENISTNDFNTAVGFKSLLNSTTATRNTAVGVEAGELNTTGSYNVFLGAYAGEQTSTGEKNVFIGDGSGYQVTTGSKNTILGRYNGNQDTWDIRTSSNNIVLSDGDGFPRMIINSSGQNYNTASVSSYWAFAVENNHGGSCGTYRSRTSSSADNTSSYHFVAWAGADRMYIYGNGNVVNTNNSYGALSDQKLKENIVDSGSQWDDVKALRVRKYSLIEEAAEAPTKLGVIAQEVEASGMGGLVFESPDRDDDGNVLETSTKQVNYSVLYMKAVKALQEAMERIETLEAENTAIKARLDALEAN